MTDGHWCLTMDVDTVSELFHLDDDPDENHNLTGQPAFRAVQDRLSDAVATFRTRS
ncbi:hypothetical protein [Streptomyces sp. NPDC006285]|uniref:hypothetical protein n=1 Tax=Streptomyces sp. NPDC006285 TaxID=3364742 RepID=UPI0036B72CDC